MSAVLRCKSARAERRADRTMRSDERRADQPRVSTREGRGFVGGFPLRRNASERSSEGQRPLTASFRCELRTTTTGGSAVDSERSAEQSHHGMRARRCRAPYRWHQAKSGMTFELVANAQGMRVREVTAGKLK
jgi:hypothetical protein